MVGEIANKYPEIIDLIKSEKHEIAFHGWTHNSLANSNSKLFEKEFNDFLELYPNCVGYRAPNFSLNNNTKWLLESLLALGQKYDSSLFPVKTPLYGMSDVPKYYYKPSKTDLKIDDGDIWEFPLLINSCFQVRIPAAGGFYLRLYPQLIKNSIKKMNSENYPAVIFFHNWEIDPMTPKIKLNLFHNFVTYHNINNTILYLRNILGSFQFISIEQYIKKHVN